MSFRATKTRAVSNVAAILSGVTKSLAALSCTWRQWHLAKIKIFAVPVARQRFLVARKFLDVFVYSANDIAPREPLSLSRI